MAVTNEQYEAFKVYLNIIVEVVENMGPDGAPAGPLYMAIQSQVPKFNLVAFQSTMDKLVATGRLRKSGHCYYGVQAR